MEQALHKGGVELTTKSFGARLLILQAGYVDWLLALSVKIDLVKTYYQGAHLF